MRCLTSAAAARGRGAAGHAVDARTNPRKLGEVLERTSRQWRAELAQQQRDMRMLGDVAATKRWLKRQRQLSREAEFDFEPF